MIFSSGKILTVVLSALNSVVAAPVEPRQLPSGQVIGYRVVEKLQLDKWNKAKTVTPDSNKNGVQIGNGQYTSPKIGDWFPKGKDSQICAITAGNPINWNKVEKVWIPEKDSSGKTLWGGTKSVEATDNYIKSLGIADPNKVAKMSVIEGFESKLQMVIPNGLTNAENGGLDLKIECHPDIAGFNGNAPDVDYYTWTNVKGTPQRAKTTINNAEDGC